MFYHGSVGGLRSIDGLSSLRLQRFGGYLYSLPPEIVASVLIDPRVKRLQFLASPEVKTSWFDKAKAHFKSMCVRDAEIAAARAANAKAAAVVTNRSAQAASDASQSDTSSGKSDDSEEDTAAWVTTSGNVADRYTAAALTLESELSEFVRSEPSVKFVRPVHELNKQQMQHVNRCERFNLPVDFDLVQFWQDPKTCNRFPTLSGYVQRLLVLRIHSVDQERVCRIHHCHDDITNVSYAVTLQ